MPELLLTLNAGSSTLKVGIFNAASLECMERRVFEGTGHAELAQLLAERKDEIIAVGHRIVHGGKDYTHPERITADVLEKLKELASLAPLHLPPEIAVIEAVKGTHPGVSQVACFDTAFHATQPRLARLLPLPRAYAEEGVMRYGFHGLSYEYIASILPEDVGERVVVAHLGSGASMCALARNDASVFSKQYAKHEASRTERTGVREYGESEVRQGNAKRRYWQSIATSMGFSALDGLMMGTRTGSIDPGALLYLMEAKGMNVRQIEALLYKESGLLGVSGISADMRELEQSDAPEAQEAIDLFCYRAACELGELVMLLGGLDALVFTAGIGEHSARVREGILAYCDWLPAFKILMLRTDEEAMIARHTARVIG